MVVCLLLLAILLGLAACGESTTVQCPPQPTPSPSRPEEWVQAPGEIALALRTTVFGTDEHVGAALFNHTQVIIETPPVPGYCSFFTAERLVGGIWQAFDTCRRPSGNPGGGSGGNLNPGAYFFDALKILLTPGTYRLKQTYAIYPHNRTLIDGTVYSLSFQVCVCARCA